MYSFNENYFKLKKKLTITFVISTDFYIELLYWREQGMWPSWFRLVTVYVNVYVLLIYYDRL